MTRDSVPTPEGLSADAADELRRRIRGAVRVDDAALGAYSTDASMYQFRPLAVIEPMDRRDIIAAVKICSARKLPVLPRGGGTSLVGQTVGPAVIIDVSRHCNRVLEIDVENRRARVEPGVVRDELNRLLAPHGLHFAPDPATSSRANIGGMIASNAAGMRSIRYGMTVDHLLQVDLALSTGEVITLGPLTGDEHSALPAGRGEMIIQALLRIVDRERDEIGRRYPKVGRRSGGYALDALAAGSPMNPARLIAGSEGTLGVILEATVNLEPLPACSGLCLAHFSSMDECLRAVEPVMRHEPTAIELLDGVIIRQARRHPMTRETCSVIEGEPEGLLIIEARAGDPEPVRDKLHAVRSRLLETGACYHAPVIEQPEEIRAVWLMRESALGLMTTVRGDRKPVPYIEDAAVPPAALPDYVGEVLSVCAKYGQPVSLFAHAGAGLLHIRPMHDLHRREDLDQMMRIQDEVFELVLKYHGSWSGEHGDGIIRGGFNERFFGPRLYRAFREIKHLFDPDGLMNPGKVIDTFARDDHLRYGDRYREPEIRSGYRWREDEGLLKAVEQCTGVGACRKLNSGVMCPSYMATRDEVHSTRGRANVLRLALTGQLGRDALSRDDVKAVFDLCLACKGCAGECPNRVDVGKMKSELLYQHYRTRRRPLRSRLMARPDLPARLSGGIAAPLLNAVLRSNAVRRLLDRLLGIDARRTLPSPARKRLSDWFASRGETDEGRTEVVLFNDLYMEYYEPETGRAAVRVLEAAGYRVTLTGVMDSQRAALSQGQLDRARREGGRIISQLKPFADRGLPILVLEPSCATALTQDLPDLVDDPDAAESVGRRIYLAEDFLAREIRAGRACLPAMNAPGLTVLYHPHCHQRTLDAGRGGRALLKLIEGADIRDSGAGCCGMAGSFGYEKEHYDLSVTVAEDRLLPAVNACDPYTRIIASGFSCRRQISDLTDRSAVHPFRIIDELLSR